MKTNIRYLCPNCGNGLHCQMLGDNLKSAVCFYCHKDVDVSKAVRKRVKINKNINTKK